jgi:hypothetical protein
LKKLDPVTKTGILVSEARCGALALSEMAELLGLLAEGPEDAAALAEAVIEALVRMGLPKGRIKDLRAALGLRPSAGTLTPVPMEASSAGRGTAAYDSRSLKLPFRKAFEDDPPASAGRG